MRVLAILALGVAGCGGTPFSNFVGTWDINSGSQLVASCPTPVGTQTTMLEGNVRILPGLGADLVTPDAAHGCDVTYTVMGSVATGTGNLVCMHAAANAANTNETDTTTTLTLTTTDGRIMTESGTGMAVFENGTGSLTCPFTLTATLTKVSNTP